MILRNWKTSIFLILLILQNWTKLIPLDLGESPRFENSDSPRSRGIPESSVSPDCLRLGIWGEGRVGVNISNDL